MAKKDPNENVRRHAAMLLKRWGQASG